MRTGLTATLAAVCLSGCALLEPLVPAKAPAKAPASPVEPAQKIQSAADPSNALSAPLDARSEPALPPADLAFELDVAAPVELAVLLRNNLDLARLARDTTPENFSEPELRRVEAATPAQARELLETEGYFDAKVTMKREAGQPPKVRVLVDPGPRTLVSSVKLEVQGHLDRDVSAGDTEAIKTQNALRKSWLLPVGAPFRNLRWTDGKSAVLARLRAEGYAAATLSGTSAEVDATLHTVRITVIADSGPRFRIGELRIEGLGLQEAASARNLSGFSKGSPATEAALLDYQERLSRSGLYEQVSVTLDTDQADPEGTPVVVRLKEAPIQQAVFGGGFSANTGPRVTFEHTHRRAFGERATTRNKFEIGRLRQAWDGELSSHAQPNLYRNLVGGTFERLVASNNGDVVRSVRVRAGRTRETTREEQFTFVQLERSQRTTAISQTGITAASINHHAVWRNVDNVLLPTLGVSTSLQTGLGVASGNTGTGPYSRVLARIGAWYPLGNNWFSSGRFELGQVFARQNLAVPDSQLFRAGGDDSVRGYAYRSVGPIVNGSVGGGHVLFTSSVEVARPISEALPSVWWATFADVGQAADRWSNLKPVWGVGMGVRWRSPVGPLSVDWAWGNATRRGRLHVGVGVVF